MAELPRLRVGLTLDSATFIRETRNVASSVDRMGRQITAQNAAAARSFEAVERGVGRVVTGFRTLGALIGIGSLAALGRQVIQTADAYTALSGRLRIVTASAKEAEQVQRRLIQIANETRGSVEAAAQLYTRLALTLGDAGVSAEQLLAVTDVVGRAVKIGGSNAAEASAGMLQFAQAMGSGVLRGDELRSVMEQLPGLTIALSRGLDQPISKFKKLGEEGFFTTERVLNALLREAPRIAEEFEKIPLQVGDAFQIMRNNLFELVGNSDQATESSRRLAQAILDVANVIGSSEFRASFQTFLTGFLDEATKRIKTTREEWRKLLEAFDAAQDFLSQFRLAEPQSLDAMVGRLNEINTRLAELRVKSRGISDPETGDTQLAVIGSIIDALEKERTAVIDQIEALQLSQTEQLAFAGTQEDMAKAANVATITIRGQAAELDKATQTFRENKIKRSIEDLSRIAEQTIKRGNQFIFQQKKASEELTASLQDQLQLQQLLVNGLSAESAEYRVQERLLTEKRRLGRELTDEQANMVRQLEQQATVIDQQAEGARFFEAAIENALESVQRTFVDTFEEIFQGGITSFSDLATSIKDIFIRLAAEIAALMVIRPVLASAAGAAGITGFAGAAAPSLASQLGPGAAGAGIAGFRESLIGGPAAIAPVGLLGSTGFLGSNITGGQALLAGGLGALGGSLIGGFFGGQGRVGGGIGGGLGAAGGALIGSVIPGLGTVAGGLIGGLGGSLLGGALGGLFGGGDSGNEVRIGRGLGRRGGSSAAARFVETLDAQIIDLLTASQERVADKLIKPVTVEYEKALDETAKAALARGRLGPAARALGFRARGITRGSAEEQLQNLVDAINLRRTIEDLTGAVTPFERQLEDLNKQFSDAREQAKEFGISTRGLSSALRDARRELREQQQAQINQLALSVIAPFEQLIAPLEAFQQQLRFADLNPAQQLAAAQQDFQRIANLARAGSTIAIDQLASAGELFIRLSEQVGASPGGVAARAEVTGVVQSVLEDLNRAQAEASKGLQDVIQRASRDQIDTLEELKDEVRRVGDEIRRLKR